MASAPLGSAARSPSHTSNGYCGWLFTRVIKMYTESWSYDHSLPNVRINIQNDGVKSKTPLSCGVCGDFFSCFVDLYHYMENTSDTPVPTGLLHPERAIPFLGLPFNLILAIFDCLFP